MIMDFGNNKPLQLLLISLLLAMIAAPIAMSFYKYLIVQDYEYILEAPCEPTAEVCYERDCSNPDYCPPNEFSYYKFLIVNARDFKLCADDSCLEECNTNQIRCEEIPCGESIDDICTSL